MWRFKHPTNKPSLENTHLRGDLSLSERKLPKRIKIATKGSALQRHIVVSPVATVNRLRSKCELHRFLPFSSNRMFTKEREKKPNTPRSCLKMGLGSEYYLPRVVRLYSQGLAHTGDVLLEDGAGGCWKSRAAAGLEVAGVFRRVITQVVLVKLQNSWNQTGTANIMQGQGYAREGWRQGVALLGKHAIQTVWRDSEIKVLRGRSRIWSVPISTAFVMRFGAWNQGI